MPIVFDIVPDLTLCRVTYSGFLRSAEPTRAFEAYLRHPDFRPGQRQFFDLSAIVGAQLDLAALLKLQRRKVAALLPQGGQLELTLFAPTPVSQSLARLQQLSWRGLPANVTIVTDAGDATLAPFGPVNATGQEGEFNRTIDESPEEINVV